MLILICVLIVSFSFVLRLAQDLDDAQLPRGRSDHLVGGRGRRGVNRGRCEDDRKRDGLRGERCL